MPTSYTSLLGFALPATGELSGTWGNTVNNSITQLVEDSVAGTATQSVAGGDWTLTTTGSGAANQARCAILIPTGSPGVSRNIIAPSQSKAYIVINQSNAAVVLKGSATTGTTIATGTEAICAWNGSDFVTVATADIGNLSGTLGVTNGGTGNTTIAARSIFVANTADTLTTVTPTAGQSIRVNAGNTAWEAYTPSSGTGDVVGPASATDNAVARFDLTTGKLIQNSAVTIADTTGDITGGAYNKVTITAPATAATLTIADGKTLTANNSITLAGTDATTMTFPATSTTVAGLGIAQTFTQDQTIAGNLTLNAQGDVRFADSDSSNWVAFQGPATVASNVTWTLPSADGTSGQVLQTNASGTLSFANLAVANGGTGQTSLTSNNVILGNGTSAVQFVAPGTNGNILTSNGTTWQSTAPAGGGSWIWLSTVSATSGTYANVETTFNSTYDVYAIVISGARPNTDNVDMFMEVKLAGSYRTSSDYKYHLHRLRSGSTLYTATANNSQVNITIAQSVQGDNANTLNYVIYVMNPSQTSSSPYYHIFGQGSQNEQSNAEIYGLVFAGGYVAASSFSPLEGVRFSWSSGQWSTGNLRLYGIKNS